MSSSYAFFSISSRLYIAEGNHDSSYHLFCKSCIYELDLGLL